MATHTERRRAGGEHEVEIHVDELGERATHEAECSADPGILAERPGESLRDHQRAEELRPTGGKSEPDRSSDVMNEKGRVAQAESIDELFEDPGIDRDRRLVPGCSLREAQTREVRRDAAEAAAQTKDEVAEDERPLSHVDEEQGGARTLIHIVDAIAFDLDEAVLEWVLARRKPIHCCHCLVLLASRLSRRDWPHRPAVASRRLCRPRSRKAFS